VNFLLRFTGWLTSRSIAGADDQCAKFEAKEKDDKKRIP